MTKIMEKIQGDSSGFETHIFKCYCGEDSYLEIIQDKEDREIFVTITKHPTRLKERLIMAWKSLRGIEFTTTNHVMLLQEDISKLRSALKVKAK